MATIKCPICGKIRLTIAKGEEAVYPLAYHLWNCHGVEFGATQPPDRAMEDSGCVFWAPCGRPCKTLEERDAHVLQHGRECILLNLLAQGGGG